VEEIPPVKISVQEIKSAAMTTSMDPDGVRETQVTKPVPIEDNSNLRLEPKEVPKTGDGPIKVSEAPKANVPSDTVRIGTPVSVESVVSQLKSSVMDWGPYAISSAALRAVPPTSVAAVAKIKDDVFQILAMMTVVEAADTPSFGQEIGLMLQTCPDLSPSVRKALLDAQAKAVKPLPRPVFAPVRRQPERKTPVTPEPDSDDEDVYQAPYIQPAARSYPNPYAGQTYTTSDSRGLRRVTIPPL
jgi:hypothetical protein